MPLRSDEFFPESYYHVYNRGANREDIFLSEENYSYCLRLLQKYMSAYEVSIVASCLMPNHYHLLVRQDGNTPVSEFIQVVFNSYVQSFNTWYDRTGTLFEGRFKHLHVDSDSYILQVCRYIHLNPVEAGLVRMPEEWPHSNYQEWIGMRSTWKCDAEFVHQYFPTAKNYQEFVIDYMKERHEDKELSKYLLD